MSITSETRHEAYKFRPLDRASVILKALEEHGPMTAKELMRVLGYTDLNQVRPRLTELKAAKLVKADKKKLDYETNRNVAVWELV